MKFRSRQTLLFLTAAVFACVAAETDAPVVHTELGGLSGRYLSVKGKETGVHAFLGVPFAKPPVGPALRLSAPQAVEGWEGVREASKQPPMCVQHKQLLIDLLQDFGDMSLKLPDISEDCLYVNIYTPANRKPDAKLPVMFWIHGGGFTSGSASMYDGSALAAYQDVVVVLVQYRLGLLGFLSTGDEHMSGNFGLLDQVVALEWVQEHIHNFGGDPNSVTVFGESAGGVSVSLMLLSPLSDGLIHRAIAESGTAAMDLLLDNNPLPATKIVANVSGCSLDSTKQIADCMRSLDFDAILGFTQDIRLRFPINVDGHFLKKPIDELFHKKEIHTIPFMTGVNDDEGGWMLPNFFAPQNWTEGMDRDHIVNVLSLFFPDPKQAVARDLIIEEYVGKGDDRVRNRDGFTEMLGDMLFNIPAIKTVNAHRDAGAPVYLYEYRYPPHVMLNKRPDFVGCDHGDELFTVLGLCFTTVDVTLADPCLEEQEELSRIMMSYWGNFARTGSPNGDGLVHWPKYGKEEDYLIISGKQVTGHQMKKQRFVFLTQTLPEKIRQHAEEVEHVEL